MLTPDALAHVDVRAFERQLASAEPLKRPEPLSAATLCLEALGLGRGPLLPEPLFAGCFEAERRTFARLAVETALFAAEVFAGVGDRTRQEQALLAGRTVASTDEDLALALLTFYASADRGDAARVAYWDYRKALATEAGLTPGPRVEAAYRALQTAR